MTLTHPPGALDSQAIPWVSPAANLPDLWGEALGRAPARPQNQVLLVETGFSGENEVMEAVWHEVRGETDGRVLIPALSVNISASCRKSCLNLTCSLKNKSRVSSHLVGLLTLQMQEK